MKYLIQSILSITSFVCIVNTSFGQENKERNDFAYSNRFSVLAGLIQPMVLDGGNIEVTYFSKRMSFDYSHGFLLNMSGGTMVGDAKDQHWPIICLFQPGLVLDID